MLQAQTKPSEPVESAATKPRPKAASRPVVRIAATAPSAPTPPAAATAVAVAPLQSARTTHAFGELPRLALDPVGAGMALVAGGSLLWLLRSGFAASLLLLGLPVWRDVDLLPVVSAGAPAGAPDDEPPSDQDADALFDNMPGHSAPPSAAT